MFEQKDGGKQSVENVGTIRVESHDTWQKWLHQPTLVTRGRKSTVFVPATKRDTLAVTSGQYTMVTTRMGRNIPAPARGASFLRRFRWATGVRRGALEVKCRTEDAVRAMGFQIQPYPVVIATNNNISAGNIIVIATNNVSATKNNVSAANNNVSATNNIISAGNYSVLASNNNVSAGNSSTGVVLSNNNNDKVPAASISTEGKQPPEVQPRPFVSSNNMEGPSTASICGPEIPPCSVVLFNDNNEARGVSTTSSSSKGKGSIVDGREVRPNNHSCENTVANPAQETNTFNGIQAGLSNVRVENGGSRKVQLAEDIAASEDAKSKPVEPSVEIKPATIEMETVPPCRNEELVAMETASCSSSREVKAEDLGKKTEKDPERKPKVKLLPPELIDLTADDGPEVVDLTTDDYLPEVYEVKFTTKIEVVHLEEAENEDTAVPMQT
ncbi:Hypp2360 [Branchiostoma lanceolatum]|uniref:Hypp2360 protein n=1 Tax=Branchiostoma lanceolatum TaxID=7740 RepID=A0A8J9ZUF3_BRALA|nr:Hypp2360 [Branchiostoma lanceolatum]